MNNVSLVGNICFDVEVNYLPGENATAVLRNTLAVRRGFKNKETGEYESDFIKIKAFGQNAENIGKFFKKGNKIGVTGEIRTGSYENKDGQKINTTEVVVNNFDFVTSKNESDSQSVLAEPIMPDTSNLPFK